MKKSALVLLALMLSGLAAAPTSANPARDTIVSGLTAEAKAADPAFTGFSAERGKVLYSTAYGTGKPQTPACTTCHGASPRSAGQTRAGKPIDPIAVSTTPVRFTDPKKLAKWFRRNCKSVLGRECTPLEKGDFITFMQTQ